MTRALPHAARSIVFVPECLTPTYADVDFRSLWEFTNRQILITKVYSTKTWVSGAATHLLYCLTLPLGLEVTMSNFFVALPAFHLAVLTFVPMLLAAIRGGLRVAAAAEILPSSRSRNYGPSLLYILLVDFVSPLFLS